MLIAVKVVEFEMEIVLLPTASIALPIVLIFLEVAGGLFRPRRPPQITEGDVNVRAKITNEMICIISN